METVTIPKESFGKILIDIDILLKDLQDLNVVQDDVVSKRIIEIKATPSIGKSEPELDAYLKKRGINVASMDH